MLTDEAALDPFVGMPLADEAKRGKRVDGAIAASNML
jgi:hypothetical protein